MPPISKKNGYVVLYRRAIIGDLNNDLKDDVIIEFGIGQGNTVVQKEAAIYLANETSISVVGGYSPNYAFVIDSISNNIAFIRELGGTIGPSPEVVGEYRYEYRNGLLYRLE